MDASSTNLIILIVAIVILALVYVYLTSKSKKRQRELKTSELKPQSTLPEPKKEIESVNPPPEPIPNGTVIETPKETEPVDVAPTLIAQSSAIETKEEAESTFKELEVTPIQSIRKRKKPLTKIKDHGVNIKDIEGIGAVYSEKLNSIGVYTTFDLLESGATPSGRRGLGEKTGISHDLILKWVNLSDLFRIKGIGEEYSELLEGAGVDTVVELSNRNAVNLHAKILEVNEAKKLVRRPPSQVKVEGWIRDARNLPRKIEY